MRRWGTRSFGVTNPSLTFDQGAGNGSIARAWSNPIPNLKPELVKAMSLVLEAKFAHDRVGFAATYYKSNSTNQLIEIPVPVATVIRCNISMPGISRTMAGNLVINATPIKNPRFYLGRRHQSFPQSQ